jgi:DinB family protein
MRNLLLSLAVAAVAVPVAAQAQDPMPASYRQVQLAQLKEQRRLLLSFADSMPERLYRAKATPAQRSFAEQVQHAAGSAAFIAGGYASATRARWNFADTAAANGTRAGLKAYINSAMDFSEARLAAQTAVERGEMTNLFGAKDMQRWQVFDEIYSHTMWTAGQTVANFRENGMAPPGFGFF